MHQRHELLVFSHLRWDFVYQRPQHLLSRLAANRRIIFFEEPVQSRDNAVFIQRITPHPNVLVCRPHTPSAGQGFCDAQLPYLETLLNEFIAQEQLNNFLIWAYTPMALPLLSGLSAQAIIYDCMDELSTFMLAPPQLIQHEAKLLKSADLVFTGGPSIYQLKKTRHHSVYCFPSSVDAAHFAQANGAIPEPEQQASLPHPRLGFYGVIDERLDQKILDALALAHPEWQIIMVGPVVKIDPNTLRATPISIISASKTTRSCPLI